MEALRNPVTGLYEIRFDNAGSALTGCFHDTDCTGARICAVNETWSAFASQCTCDGLLGFVGSNCDVWGDGTVYIFAVLTATIIVLTFATSASVYCMWAVLRLREKWSSNLFIAVSVATLANSQFLASTVIVLYNALSFPHAFVTHPGPDDRYPERLVKEQALGAVHIIMLAFAYILSTLAMIFLLGVWASIAIRFNEMSPAQGRMIERICAVYALFALAVYIPTGLVYVLWIVNGIISAFVGMVLSIGFMVIGMKVKKITGYIQKEKAESTTQPTLVVSSTRILLRRIYLTSFVLSGLCAIAVITLAVYAVGPYRRTAYIAPAFIRAPREVSYRLAFLTCALADLVVILYLSLTVFSKLKAAKASESPSTSHSGSPNPNLIRLLGSPLPIGTVESRV